MSLPRALALSLALVLAGLGALGGEGAWFAAALPLAAWALAGEFVAPPRISLEAERTLSETFADSGAPVEISVNVRNRGPRLEALQVSDALPPGAILVSGSAQWRGSLELGAEAELRYVATLPRGLWRFEEVRAVALDPFFDLGAEAVIPCPQAIVVPPKPLSPPKAAFGAGAVRPFAGQTRASRTGSGIDFSATRDYSPGDPLRSLNRKAEMRWGRTIVNLREEGRAIDAGVILDSRASAYADAGLFESCAAAALTLAELLLDQGCRVAFMSSGAGIDWVPPGMGRTQRLRVRRAAAAARLGDHATFERFEALPTRIFPPRSLVAVASPLLERDLAPLRSFAALGYSVVALRPDPLAAPRRALEARPDDEASRLALRLASAESRFLLSRLLGSGVSVLAWDPGLPLASARLLGEAAS
ncbi:MAG TPA: DUF58 domain-containing protein [Spirochaetales bacterium]|nr:DUF58 domain-containing protein [Spirochaetales bacterium]